MRSHFLHMLVYATLVASFFALLLKSEGRVRIRFAATLWLAMVGGALLLAYLMYPFPR